MEKKKNNKKLFAIIAASALAFVLTVALSVSITLAYFGQAQKETDTITLGNAITVGTLTTAGTDVAALPNVEQSVTVTGKVTSAGTKDATKCYIRIKATGDAKAITETVSGDVVTYTAEAKFGGETVNLSTADADGYMYFVTEASGTTLKEYDPTTSGKDVVVTFKVKPNAGLTNTSANKTISVSFEIAATQSAGNGNTTTTATWPEAA